MHMHISYSLYVYVLIQILTYVQIYAHTTRCVFIPAHISYILCIDTNTLVPRYICRHIHPHLHAPHIQQYACPYTYTCRDIHISYSLYAVILLQIHILLDAYLMNPIILPPAMGK